MTRALSLFGIFVSLTLNASTGSAQEPIQGQEYRVIDPAQPTAVEKGKVEVVEIFYYGCSHCFDFEPQFNKWKGGKPKEASVTYMPAMFGEKQAPAAKLYYALEEMGLVEKLHGKIYDEIHVRQHQELLDDPDAIAKFLAKQGVDAKRFREVYDSFGVANKVGRATQMMGNYRVKGTPSVVVNGKYITGPSMTVKGDQVDFERFSVVLNQLVAMEIPKAAAKKTKKKKAAPKE